MNFSNSGITRQRESRTARGNLYWAKLAPAALFAGDWANPAEGARVSAHSVRYRTPLDPPSWAEMASRQLAQQLQNNLADSPLPLSIGGLK